MNRSWQEYTGYSPQKLSDSGWRAIIHADDLPAFLKEWNIALSAGRSFETEARLQRSDDQYRWFLIKKALAVSGQRNGKPLVAHWRELSRTLTIDGSHRRLFGEVIATWLRRAGTHWDVRLGNA